MPLVRGVVSALMLLEHSADDEINPDVAVQGMEAIAYALGGLGDDDRAVVRRCLDDLAREAADAGDPGQAEFLRSTPFALGWE